MKNSFKYFWDSNNSIRKKLLQGHGSPMNIGINNMTNIRINHSNGQVPLIDVKTPNNITGSIYVSPRDTSPRFNTFVSLKSNSNLSPKSN